MNSSSDAGRTFILPTTNVTIGTGRNRIKVRCLIDSGSQRSYLSKKVYGKIGKHSDNATKLLVNTFLEADYKDFIETAVTVNLENSCANYTIPFLLSEDVDLTYKIDGLSVAHANLSSRFALAEKFTSDEVHMEGLLGVDAIQYFKLFEIVPYVVMVKLLIFLTD